MPPRLRPVLMLVVAAVVTFGLSGQWLDPWLWAWLLVWSACFAYALGSISDDLARERFAPPEKSADRIALHFIRATGAIYFPESLTPNRPASSCVNCQATRPDREPRVVDHSSASRSSASSSILMP